VGRQGTSWERRDVINSFIVWYSFICAEVVWKHTHTTRRRVAPRVATLAWFNIPREREIRSQPGPKEPESNCQMGMQQTAFPYAGPAYRRHSLHWNVKCNRGQKKRKGLGAPKRSILSSPFQRTSCFVLTHLRKADERRCNEAKRSFSSDQMAFHSWPFKMLQ
jgi:hypothetical protein